MSVTNHPHVELRGETPFVAGTKTPVRTLWHWHCRGIPVATLMNRFPQLGPAKVLSALAYAYDNQEVIERDITSSRDASQPEISKKQEAFRF